MTVTWNRVSNSPMRKQVRNFLMEWVTPNFFCEFLFFIEIVLCGGALVMSTQFIVGDANTEFFNVMGPSIFSAHF